jgi:hypothetical protein
MDDANRWIGPILRLPTPPFVDFGDSLPRERPDGVRWKAASLVDHAAGCPFAWVDDEQTEADHAHIATTHPAAAPLHHVNPRLDLRPADFRSLAAFADSVSTAAARQVGLDAFGVDHSPR